MYKKLILFLVLISMIGLVLANDYITFEPPTLADNTNSSSGIIRTNVTFFNYGGLATTELFINFYDTVALVYSEHKIFALGPTGNTSYYTNYTPINNGVYYYNASFCRFGNTCNDTETRQIVIDTEKPIINILYPPNGKLFQNFTVNFTWNITDIFNITTSISSGELANLTKAYYQLNESTGTFTQDVAPYNYSMTVTGGSDANWVDGKINGSRYFNGATDATTTFYPSDNDSTPLSVFGWINVNSFANYKGVISDLSLPSTYGWVLYTHSTGKLCTYINAHRCSVGALSTGVWYLVGFTYDGNGNLKMYVNNQSEPTNTGVTFTKSSDDKLTLGRFYSNSNSLYFDGTIDEVGIWNRTLSQSDINLLYNNGNGVSYPFTISSSVTSQANGTGISNSTIFVYNHFNVLVNETIFMDLPNIYDPFLYLNITLPEGVYTWSVNAVDFASNELDTPNQSFTIHLSGPLLNYGIGTAADGANLSQTFVYINVSMIELQENNITFNLFSQDGVIVSSVTKGPLNYSINFTPVSNGVYYYNVTACDVVNLCNTTITRKIILDTTPPSVITTYPSSGHITNSGNINLTWNVTDISFSLTNNLTQKILAYYPLDNNTDVTGNGYDLNNRTGNYSAGLIGNALTGDYIYGQGIFSNLRTQDANSNISVCMWTYTNIVSPATNYGLFGFLNLTGFGLQTIHSQFDFAYANSGTSWQYLIDGAGTGIFYVSSNLNWQYHCMTKNATEVSYYHNGVLIENLSYIATKNSTTVEILLGAANDTGFLRWTGKIDEVGIWGRALSAFEVNQLYNNASGVSYPFTQYNFAINSNNTVSGVRNSSLYVFNQSGRVSTSLITNIGNIFSFIITLPLTLAEGIYTWFADAYDYAANLGVSGNKTFTIDSSPPHIVITFPLNTTYADGFITQFNTSSHLDWTITDLSPLSACWYQIDGSTPTYVPCYLNTTSFGLSYGGHNITLYSNDSLGQTGVSAVQATWKFILRTNSITYSPISTELTAQTFVYNATLGPSITGVSMILKYNNTDYVSTLMTDGTNQLFTNNLITPSVSTTTNIPFFWNVTASDSINNYNLQSQNYNQTITPIHIGVCDGVNFTQQIYNFTAYDEDTLNRIEPFFFGGTFSYSVNGTFKKHETIAAISNEIDVCINPSNSIINLDIDSTYDEDKNISQNYTQRNYVIQNHIKSNSTENVNLTLLQISKSTTFVLKVQDKDLVPLPNYIINTYRKNPSTGTFYLTQTGRTDSNGITSGFFEVNTVDYKFVITHNDVVVLATTPEQKVIVQGTPPTLVFTINPSGQSAFTSLINITDFNFTFTNTSTGIDYSYSDSSNNFTNSRLAVYLINYSGPNVLVCNITSPLSSAILSCNFNGVNGTYTAIGYLTRNGQEFFVDAINLIFPFGGLGWGLYGVFLGLLIIMVCAFAFRYNEIAGIWLVTLAIIFVNLIGFINFGITFITASIAVAIILTVVMKQ